MSTSPHPEASSLRFKSIHMLKALSRVDEKASLILIMKFFLVLLFCAFDWLNQVADRKREDRKTRGERERWGMTCNRGSQLDSNQDDWCLDPESHLGIPQDEK